MNSIQKLEKSTYVNLAKKKGVEFAVNQLHSDLWEIEKACFDTPDGFQPEVWTKLNEFRLFSRELWDLSRE